jgi:glycine cleavage system regulatory protein
MKSSLVITLLGKDRPGLVRSLAAVVERHDGNWEESRFVRVGGAFAGLVSIYAPEERIEGLQRALGNLGEVSVSSLRVADEPLVEARHLNLEVICHDQPGIVRRLTSLINAQGINVEEFESGVSSAPMSGEKLFRARARLRTPKTVTRAALEEVLGQLTADSMIDLTVDESETR